MLFGTQQKEPLAVTVGSSKCTDDLLWCTAEILNVCLNLCLHQIISPADWEKNQDDSFGKQRTQFKVIFHLYKGL